MDKNVPFSARNVTPLNETQWMNNTGDSILKLTTKNKSDCLLLLRQTDATSQTLLHEQEETESQTPSGLISH